MSKDEEMLLIGGVVLLLIVMLKKKPANTVPVKQQPKGVCWASTGIGIGTGLLGAFGGCNCFGCF